MKKYFLVFLLFPFFSSAQSGMWTWIKGSSTNKPPGSFGTQGIESSTNNPPGFWEGATWTDLYGNFWLFGGQNTTSSDSHGDLWKYNPVTNNWTWMKGTGQINTTGDYGVKGVSSPTNMPPARSWGVVTWVDLNGDLWMFGGATHGNLLGDLWKYNIASNEWTWVGGSNTLNSPAVYGTRGIPSTANTPGARCKTMAGWVDDNNNLWLFGGYLLSPAFNDLWRKLL